MSRASVRKGKDFERALAIRFREAMPDSGAKRGIGQVRHGGEVADVDVPCFWVEAKHRKATSPEAALKQAEVASEGSAKWPVAVVKKSGQRGEPLVAMRLDDFLDLVGEWWSQRQQ